MLTEKQQEVYDFIIKCKRQLGFYPSLKDIANNIKGKRISPQAIAARVKWIEKKGFLVHKGKRDYKVLK